MRIGHFHLCGAGISRAATAFPKLFSRKNSQRYDIIALIQNNKGSFSEDNEFEKQSKDPFTGDKNKKA